MTEISCNCPARDMPFGRCCKSQPAQCRTCEDTGYVQIAPRMDSYCPDCKSPQWLVRQLNRAPLPAAGTSSTDGDQQEKKNG